MLSDLPLLKDHLIRSIINEHWWDRKLWINQSHIILVEYKKYLKIEFDVIDLPADFFYKKIYLE